MGKLEARASGAHMLDAGMQAVNLLSHEERSRPRILLFIGQAADAGSTATVEEMEQTASRGNVTIHALTLPIAGKRFVAETFSLGGKEGSGFVASVDLEKIVPALRKGAREVSGTDPFTLLASATGGTQIHFRKQAQLENALIAMGAVIRTSYLRLFSPGTGEPGYHRLSVGVDLPGGQVYSGPGYWRN